MDARALLRIAAALTRRGRPPISQPGRFAALSRCEPPASAPIELHHSRRLLLHLGRLGTRMDEPPHFCSERRAATGFDIASPASRYRSRTQPAMTSWA
jgi:hypothetical protein